MIGYIYKYTNPANGKVYIGKTCSLSNRKSQHRTITVDKRTKFGNALRKYGIENFEFELIITIKCNGKDNLNYGLNFFETYFISLYQSHIRGYNCTLGGEGTVGFSHTEEAKRKMRNRNVSEITRKKLSISSKGRKLSKTHAEKLKQAVIDSRSIPVKQISKEGKFIRIWKSASEAARALGAHRSDINRVCNKQRKTSQGFIWEYCQT